jgi:hypothetical protein
MYVAVGNFSREAVNLYENVGAVFLNRAATSGVARASLHPLTFGLRFLDADLDGHPDLLLVNGHIEPTVNEVQKDITYAQPPQLLRGVAGRKFQDVSAHLGDAFNQPVVGRGLAVADVDGDGDLDLCISVNGGPPRLLRCEVQDAARRSLRIRVRGPAPGTDAFGARVDVVCDGAKQVQWVRSGGSFLSQSELTLTFGVPLDGKSSVTVTFPAGDTVTREELSPGLHEITR